MGQYDKIRARIRALEDEIKALKVKSLELAEIIENRENERADCIAQLVEMDAIDNTDPEHRGEEVYW